MTRNGKKFQLAMSEGQNYSLSSMFVGDLKDVLLYQTIGDNIHRSNRQLKLSHAISKNSFHSFNNGHLY